MGEVATVDERVERVSAGQLVRGVLAVGLVGLLVAGSSLLGGADNQPYEDAGADISGFYNGGSATAFIDRWDERFTERFADNLGQLEQDISGILTQGSQVESEGIAVVAGVPIVVVATSEGIQWCVRPDGTILPTCQLGDVGVTVDASALGATGEYRAGGMDLNRAEITFELASASGETIMLEDIGTLVGATGPWQISGVVQRAGGQFFPPGEDGSLQMGEGFTLAVTLQGDLGGTGGWDPTELTWLVGGEEVLLSIPGPSYWLS